MSPDAAEYPDLIQALQARCGDIAERWYRAVSPTGFTPLDSACVRRLFVGLAGQLISLLADGSLESGRAEAIGSAMADLHYIQPETWDRTQEVLRRLLVEGLSPDQICVVQHRLAACIGKMATGFFRRAREIMLTEQEQIREALIAEREQVLEELQRSEDLFRTIVETAPSFLLITDAEGFNTYVSPSCEEMLGYTQQELMGSVVPWVHEDDFPIAQEIYVRVYQERKGGRDFEYKAVKKDGEVWYASSSWEPLWDEAGNFKGIVLQTTDVTRRKRVEEALEAERALLAQRVAERTAELRAANDELAQIARLKGEFVSNVSHELRTPLSVITLVSGNLDTLYERLDDDVRRQMIRDIRAYVREMNHIVGNVLEVSRIDSGRVSTERQPVDLAQLMREEAERHAPLIRQKSHALSVSGFEHLPVWGNEGQLRRVIRNLLDNAIKYTPDGGQITCESRLWEVERGGGESPGVGWPGTDALPAGRWAAFCVADTGLGISQEDQLRVFERFYRVQVRGNVTGTGLGLSIARELVELHGGRIAIDSTLGQGSNFAVYLPLLEE
jgi:PAS domain S-box-containing protein